MHASYLETEWRRGLRKHYNIVSDEFQDLVRVTSPLQNVHRDVLANIQIVCKFVHDLEWGGVFKGIQLKICRKFEMWENVLENLVCVCVWTLEHKLKVDKKTI